MKPNRNERFVFCFKKLFSQLTKEHRSKAAELMISGRNYTWINKVMYRHDASAEKFTHQFVDHLYRTQILPRNPSFPPSVEWYPLNRLGYADYSITRKGEVFDNRTNALCKGTETKDGRRVTLQGRKEYVHRLVAQMFLGPAPFLNATVQVDRKTMEVEWVKKNSSRVIDRTRQSCRRDFRRAVSMVRRAPTVALQYEYGKYMDVVTWLSIEDAAAAFGWGPEGKRNIKMAIKKGSKCTAYDYWWNYALESMDDEVWVKYDHPGYEKILVSTKGRIRLAHKSSYVGYGTTNPETGVREFLLRKENSKSEEGGLLLRVDVLAMHVFYGAETLRNWISGSGFRHINGVLTDNSLTNLTFLNDNVAAVDSALNQIRRLLWWQRENHRWLGLSLEAICLHWEIYFGHKFVIHYDPVVDEELKLMAAPFQRMATANLTQAKLERRVRKKIQQEQESQQWTQPKVQACVRKNCSGFFVLYCNNE
jgi:hypothetical protein